MGRNQETATLERTLEQILDGRPAIVFESSSAGACEVMMSDHRGIGGAPLLPFRTGPGEPGVLTLIEHAQRLITELGELSAPSRSALHCSILEDGPNDIDLLTVVHLIPDGLKDPANGGSVGVTAVHQS